MTCFVLIRPDLKFHAINMNYPDARTGTRILYNQPAICGITTPAEPTDILQYTSMWPEDWSHACYNCMKMLTDEIELKKLVMTK